MVGSWFVIELLAMWLCEVRECGKSCTFVSLPGLALTPFQTHKPVSILWACRPLPSSNDLTTCCFLRGWGLTSFAYWLTTLRFD